ncbi:hypothetical protein [Lysinibacillus boronitolerans]|uniref:hypothetical protein n=1 Tax=Lysinibacillus TaxID=400634 RepID=UPI00289A4FE1|nr:hypothetical protein [Lysinibacillus boronitolerans]
MTEVIESRMKFSVDDTVDFVKFDETTFFNKHFKKLQDSKGIDFIFYDTEANEYVIIEVKNFRGAEQEPTTKNRLKINHPDSVITETALKVRDSLSCLIGVSRSEQDSELKSFQKILKKDSKIKIILLLEANSVDSKCYKILTDDLKKKLAWLNIRVLVANKDDLQKYITWLQINNIPD